VTELAPGLHARTGVEVDPLAYDRYTGRWSRLFVPDTMELPFRSGCFDAVICQLGLQFYPDPARGLGEFRRVLRPEGIAAVCVISEPDSAPIWGFLAEAIVKHLPEKRDILMASFSLSDAKRFEELMRAAGFANVGVKRVIRDDIVRGLDDYWNSIDAGIGSMPQIYLMLNENDRRRVRDEVTTKLSRFAVGSELRLSMEMLIGHGQAGAAAETSTPSSLDASAPIDPRLGDCLVCPRTKGPLTYDSATGELVSQRGGLAFPIRDGIPIMLPDAARVITLS
jgi:uncharacterized protein YbaR (Trm112 family)/SAM-dependent methyltransferase